MMKITLPPDAAKALQKGGDVKVKPTPKTHPMIQRVCLEQALRARFGPAMMPSFRERCFYGVSMGTLHAAFVGHQWRVRYMP